jgi:hypothetical protein
MRHVFSFLHRPQNISFLHNPNDKSIHEACEDVHVIFFYTSMYIKINFKIKQAYASKSQNIDVILFSPCFLFIYYSNVFER